MARTFEYDEVFIPLGDKRDRAPALGRLNFLGAMGWELITRRDTVRNNGVGMAEGWECLFKREIENVRQSPQEKTALQEAAAEPRGKKS